MLCCSIPRCRGVWRDFCTPTRPARGPAFCTSPRTWFRVRRHWCCTRPDGRADLIPLPGTAPRLYYVGYHTPGSCSMATSDTQTTTKFLLDESEIPTHWY